MQGSSVRVTWLTAAVAFAVACSSSSGTTTATVPPAPEASQPSTPPTTAPTNSPTTAAATPTTTPSDPVGDPAALQALVEQVALDTGIPLEEFFVPDITQPDPMHALRELLEFSEWAFATAPDTDLAVIHTIEGSPAFARERANLDTYASNGWVSRHVPYEFRNLVEVDLADVPLSDAERAELPEGARAFQFQTASESGMEIVDPTTDEVVSSVPPWESQVFLIVVAPTEVGWQEYWYFVVGVDG